MDMVEKRPYTATALETITATPEEILSGVLDEEIYRRMTSVIETEAPVVESLMFKRVLNSLSLARVGSRLLSAFQKIAMTLPFPHEEYRNENVYKNGKDENFFRAPSSLYRYSYQIPLSEAVECLLYIMERETRILTKAELSVLFRNELGFERMGSQVEALFSDASRSGRLLKTGNGRFKPIADI